MTALSLETVNLTKRFGAFTALDGVSLHVRPGTVHALLGENGAGKSTLVKCIVGYQRPDDGAVLLGGREHDIHAPTVARALGIGMVYQHFTVVPGMTVAENLLIARGALPAVIDWKAVRTELPTDRRLRELAICTVALLTGAQYEYHHHAPDFLAAGGTPAELDALARVVARDARAEARDAALGELEQLVIRYAAQMTLDVRVDDTLFAALRGHFDTTALVELTSAIATYNMVARFLVALGVTPEN